MRGCVSCHSRSVHEKNEPKRYNCTIQKTCRFKGFSQTASIRRPADISHRTIIHSKLYRTRDAQCKALASPSEAIKEHEKHKIFDEATIICESGRGGNGEISHEGKGKWVRNFKYNHGSGQKKMIWLPASEPANGEHGSDVVLVADASVSDLLHLHERRRWSSRKGANGNPAEGTGGPKRRDSVEKRALALKIPLPMGTVVKDNKGRLIAELLQRGDTFCVCKGGRGGHGTLIPAHKPAPPQHTKRNAKLQKEGIEFSEVQDTDWKTDARGGEGETRQITLQLRVVADAGIVGLPNVGKTTLLRAMTRSAATVANYPFTTLMPNLGVLSTASATDFQHEPPPQQLLVDLPGLIEGAHLGRGLGRMFLRHLARTQVVVHVVDAAAENPAADYWVVREELRMFNPEYCSRPCTVVLNKMDLPDASDLQEELVHEIWAMAKQLEKSYPGIHVLPVNVLCCSAQNGTGLAEVSKAVAAMLGVPEASDTCDDDIVDWEMPLPDH